MKKILIFIIGFYLGVVLFLPKENLYYKLQTFLKTQNIYINSNINSTYKLDLSNGVIYYNSMDIAKFDDISIYPYLLFNYIHIKNLSLNIGKISISSANVYYTLFYPIKVFIKGDSKFAKIDGYIDLISKEVKIYFLDIKNSSIKNLLKKDKKGYYYYAKF